MYSLNVIDTELLDSVHELIDAIDEARELLSKLDTNWGLTDNMAHAQLRLRELYSDLSDDVNNLEDIYNGV